MAKEYTVTKCYPGGDVDKCLTLTGDQLVLHEMRPRVLDLTDEEDRQFATNFIAIQEKCLRIALKEAQRELKACAEIKKFLRRKKK